MTVDVTQQLKHFSDAFNRIRTDYVHQTDDQQLLTAAITGIQNMEGHPGALPSASVAEAALDSMTGALDPTPVISIRKSSRNRELLRLGNLGAWALKSIWIKS